MKSGGYSFLGRLLQAFIPTVIFLVLIFAVQIAEAATYSTPVTTVSPGWSNHRKRAVFYNGDRFFIIYYKGGGDTNLYYDSSSDNASWDGETLLISTASSVFDIYLVSDTKFDLAFKDGTNNHRATTCTISGSTITVGSTSTWATGVTSPEVVVGRSGGGDRVYVASRAGTNVRIYAAVQTGDVGSGTTWNEEHDAKEDPFSIAMVPYQNSDQVLVVYGTDANSNADGVYSRVIAYGGGGGSESQCDDFNEIMDISSPIRISDTEFRIIVRDTGTNSGTPGIMSEYRWNGSGWNWVEDLDAETDQDSPSLFYDRLTGAMYVFSVDTGSDDVERHDKASGGSWQAEVVADNGEGSTHTSPITQMHEPPYGSSRTCNELVWGYRTTGYDLHVGSESLTACADTSPPDPDPMSFAVVPDDASPTSIDMTATTATDPSTPVEYLFTFTACGSNGGTGGSDSSWQASTTYTDITLQPNKCYGYTVTARDSLSNTGNASPVSEAYTAANVPGTPTLSNASSISLDLTNDENGNPASSPTTMYAVQVVTTTDGTWLNQYVDANGNPSATAVWHSDATMDGLKLRGLQPSTLYGVQVKARNEDGDETGWSLEGQGTTTAPGPYLEQIHYRWLNDDGVEGAASWAAPEDTPLSSVASSSAIRLRVEISNEGPANDPGPTTFLLEYATSTAGPWTPVEVASVATNSHWQMVDSSYYADGDGSNNIDPGLTDENGSFLAGKLKDTSNLTADLPLTTTQFTEIEYCLQATSKATPGATYYFRLSDDGTALHDYLQYGRVTLSGGGSWLNSDWLYRKHLRIDSSRVAGNLTNFPVLISTTDLDWRDSANSGHVAQADGGDIVFAAGDGVTKLDHEIEKYVPSTGELVAWVEAPSLSGSADTNLYIYYGNSSLAEGDNQWNTMGTWDEGGSDNYKGVWHIGEGGTGTRFDSTQYDNDLTPSGYEGDEANSNAKIDGADDFDGSDDRLYVSSDALRISGNVTVEAWFRIPASMGTNEGMVTTANPGDIQTDNVLYSLQSADADQLIYYHEYGSGNNQMVTWNYLFSPGTWYHVSIVRDVAANTVDFYVDGAFQQQYSYTTDPDGGGSSQFNIGDNSSGGTTGSEWFLNATIDEVRVSSTTRSAAWIETEYNNQKAPAAFYTVGIEESPGAGADPFNNGWSYRKRMTIDASQVSADLTNFPVLVKTTDPDLTKAQADFDDIFFTAANGTMKLDHEIEKYNSSTGELEAWVEVPTVSSTSNTDIYLYYGNATAVDQRNPTGAGVWEPNYVGVWHLRETSGAHAGSTWNYHTGSPQGALNQDTTGPIDGADYFNGSDAYVDVSHDESLNFGTDDFTVEAWVKSTQAQVLNEYPKILEKLVDSPSKQGYRLVLYSSTDSPYPLFDVWSGGSAEGAEATVDIRDDSWHHLVGVKTSGEVRIYIDGTSSGSAPHSLGTTSSTGDLFFGRSVPWNSDYFEGTIDEVRISNTARSAAWTQAQYNNITNPLGFFLTGIEEGPATNGDPFQNGWTYRKRLTIDASRVATDLTDFPVLINTTDADWKEDDSYSGHVAQDDGGDIIFTAGDGVTRLYHEIEKYEPSTGELVAWVKVPSLSSSTNTNIYIYYGNTSLGVDENQWNTAGLWPDGYKGIYHFAEDPSITTDGDCAGGIYEICDATLNDNDGDMQGGVLPGQLVSAKVGDGLDFDGSDDYFLIKQTNDFDQSVITVQAWINTTSVEEKRIMMNNTSGSNDWCFTMEDNGGSASVLLSNSASADDNQMTNATLADGQWHHVVAISDPVAANIKIYVDGNLASTAMDPGETFGGGDTNSPIIGRAMSLSTAYFLGKMDEVRVYTGALTAEWIATEYNNQQAPAAFYTVGVEETSGTGANPFNNGWSYRKRITIDSAQIPSDQSNFPVLIKTIDPDLIFGGGNMAQDDGGDILFTAGDGTTKLDHEIENYVNGTGELVVWVEVRSLLSTSDTDIYLYYGNASAVDQWNPTGAGVWEPNYAAVWHLDESSGTQISDSTAYGNTGTKLSATEPNPAAGQIAGAQDFDGTNDIITINNSSGVEHVLDFTAGPYTLSAWFKAEALNKHIVGKKITGSNQYQFGIGNLDPPNVFFSDDDEIGVGSTGLSYDGSNWYYGAVVVDASGNPELYLNGAQETWNGDARPFTFTHRDVDVTIGMHTAAAFMGLIDEVRISKTARSADWVQIEYNNLFNPDGFYTFGIEEGPGTVGDPFQNGWSYRKRLTIDASRVAGDLTNFPVLISTTDADWIEDSQPTPGHVAQTDGGDIMFTASDGVTKLDHEIEKYDETTGELVAWVEVRSLSGTNNTNIYIYYGNTSLDEAENQWNASGVWDTNYVGVWHLHDDLLDSTSNDNDGTDSGGSTNGASQIADGQIFDGIDNYIYTANSFNNPQEFSMEAWFKTDSASGKKIVGFESDQTGEGSSNWDRHIYIGTDGKVYFGVYDGTQPDYAISTNIYYDNEWHHVVAVRDDTTDMLYLYVDGNEVDNETSTAAENYIGYWRIASWKNQAWTNGANGYFPGTIDEVRVSNSARDAAWIETEYNNQKAPAAFYTVGIEETTGTGADPFNNGWSYRKRITIDSAQVDCDLTNFPVLVSATDPDLIFGGGHMAQDDGGDILFTAADGTTKLDHEIERYTNSTGELVVWVEVRSLASTSDTDIYLYYGNANAVDQWNPTGAGVWEPNYAGVWHLEESVTDEEATGTHTDSTSYGNDGAQDGNEGVAGKIAGGQDFDGTDDYVDAGNDTSLVIWNSDFTLQAWVKLDTKGADMDVITKAGDGVTVRPIELRYDVGEDYWEFNVHDGAFQYAKYTQANPQLDMWYHIVGVRDGSTIKIYVDGVEGAETDTFGTLADSSAFSLLIGRLLDPGGPRYFDGLIDEVRVSKIARDACWIEAEHNNQSDPEGFYTIGIEEQDDTESDPLQNGWTYRKRLTIDASRVAGNLTNFPVLISTTDADWIEDSQLPMPGHVAQTDGGDIMFTAGDGITKLDHEIEKYEPSTGELVAWVEVRSLSGSTNTDIYIYYGNTSLDEDENQWNSVGVWDNDYVGVWHLDETPSDGTSGGHEDSTAYDNDGTPYNFEDGGGGSTDATGQIDGADYFAGDNDYVDCGSKANLDVDYITIEFWLNLNAGIQNDAGILAKGINTSRQYWIWYYGGGVSFEIDNDVLQNNAWSPQFGQWEHLVLTYDGTNVTTYRNGVQENQYGQITGPIDPTTHPLVLGNIPGFNYLNGNIDEVRISSTSRSPQWIQTSYNNQKAPAAFYTVGIEEEQDTTADPFHNGWQYNKKITILASEVAADLTNFPVLIKTTDPDWADTLNGGNVAQADGGDILFIAGDGTTKLDHQIERYNETTGELVAWVEVRSLSGSEDTDIYIFYGNANAVDQWNPTGAGVWEPNYVGVWHLNEAVNDEEITGTHYDSTWDYNDGRQNRNDDDAGQMANGQVFDATDDYVDLDSHIGDYASLSEGSVSIWFKYTDTSDFKLMFSASCNSDASSDLDIMYYRPDNVFMSGIREDGVNVWNCSFPANYADGSWHHYVMTVDSSGNKHFIDGGQITCNYVYGGDASTQAFFNSVTGLNTLRFGNREDSTGNEFHFGGNLDEVRVSRVARSAAWIATEHSNQSDPANFYIVDTNECDNSNAIFDNRTPITIHGYQVSGTSGSLTNFPLLVSIDNDPELKTIENGGKVFSDGGYDIVFRADDGTTGLDHEVEHYDGVNGTLVAWVRIPSLSKSADTLIYMYFGNCAVTTPSENPEAVWDSNYKGVWHLRETVTDEETTGTHYDSTSNDNDGAQSGNGYDAAGQINGAQDFDGTDDYVDLGTMDVSGSALTISLWAELDTTTPYDQRFIAKSNGLFDADHWWMVSGYDNSSLNTDTVRFRLKAGGSTTVLIGADDTITTDQFFYITAVYDGSKMYLYVDGSEIGTTPKTGNLDTDNTVPANIARNGDGYGEFDGIIDEVRISNTARDADWIKTEYNNQSNPSAFYSIGTDDVSPATAVDLVSFTAKGEGSSVLVEWETAQELNHMGFYLYRARNPGGPFTKLTDKLISGLTSSVVGREYSYEDQDVTRGEIYYYQLEDIDIYGKKTLHGPICVDWDGDGLPDDWEIANGLNPGFPDADLDWDGDGLTNLEEYLRGTDPFNPDTDGDSILDGDEDIERDPDDQYVAGTLGRGVYIVASDDTGITLELRTESFDFTVVRAEGQEFERLSIKEYIHGFTSEVGKPELPVKGILLDIPDGNAATLTVLETEDEILSGYRVHPVPETAVDDHGQLAHVGEIFVMDEAAYLVDAFYPDTKALLGREYIFRGQQKQQIFFYPLTFNPARGEIRHCRRIRVRVDYEDMQTQSLTTRQFYAVPSAEYAQTAAWTPPSANPAYKIFVSQEGIYRLTKSWLEAQFVDVGGFDLSQVRIYNLGQEIAISVYDENGDTHFDPEDYIDFYGRAVEENYAKYATENVYWLITEGGLGAPRRMAAIDGTPVSVTVPSTHTFTVHHEEDRKYWARAPGGDSLDRHFFDPYVIGQDLAYPGAGDPVSFNLFLPGVSGQGTLKIMMAGTWAPYHQVDVSLNGTPLGTYSWSDIAFYQATIEGVDLVDGNNTVTLECLTGVDAIAVDWFEVTYPRSFQTNGDTLTFSHETGYRFQVSEFSANNLLAFDITSPANVDRLINFEIIDAGGPGPYTLDFEPISGSGQRTYLVLTSDQVKTPAAVIEDVYTNLAAPTIGADYIIITHRDLGWDVSGDPYPWLNDLTALRQARGLRVKVVDVEDVFDEFSYGIEAPEAILGFLEYAYASWTQPVPQYVLLVGDSTRNPKNNPDPTYGLDTITTYIPTYLTFTEHMGETATDEWFARVSGDDAISDLYIGRLPAKSAAEARVMVNKVLAYEGSLNTKSWEKNVLLLADDQRDGSEYEYEVSFEIMNNDVAALLPPAMNDPVKGYLNDYFDADNLSAEIIAQINNGTLMVNYSGHSSIQILANHRITYENIFNNSDVDVLTNSTMYPLFVSMGCLSGHFVYPEGWNWPSLAEALLRAEDKGAAAALMSTGLTTTEGQHILDTALFDAIFNQDVRVLGQAVSAAKQTLMANGDSTYEEVNETFLLFGDPAMTLKVPLPQRPQGLSAQGHASGVVLSWNAATDCNGGAVSGYNLYRSTTPGGSYTKVNTSLITGTQYDDISVSSTRAQYTSSSAASGPTYYYVVTSVDADGDESVYSLEASGGTQSADPPDSGSVSDSSSGGGGGGGCFINTVAGK